MNVYEAKKKPGELRIKFLNCAISHKHTKINGNKILFADNDVYEMSGNKL